MTCVVLFYHSHMNLPHLPNLTLQGFLISLAVTWDMLPLHFCSRG